MIHKTKIQTIAMQFFIFFQSLKTISQHNRKRNFEQKRFR